jgi:two-component system, LuxR family, response regulator FixJ
MTLLATVAGRQEASVKQLRAMAIQSFELSTQGDPQVQSGACRIGVFGAGDFFLAALRSWSATRPLRIELAGPVSDLESDWGGLNLILAQDQNDQVAELAKWFRREGIALPIVAFAENPSIEQVVRAIKAGADDYLAQPFDSVLLDRIIFRTARDPAQAAAAQLRRVRAQNAVEKLSSREREILVALATGLTSPQMADKFSISRRTVDTHRFNLRRKLGSIPTAVAIRLVVECGLDRQGH